MVVMETYLGKEGHDSDKHAVDGDLPNEWNQVKSVEFGSSQVKPINYLMQGVNNENEEVVIEGELAVLALETGSDPHQTGVHQSEH